MSTLTAVALSGEITGGVYSAAFDPLILSHSDQAIADLLNSNTNPSGKGIVAHIPIPGSDFLADINPTDLATLTTAELQQLQIYTAQQFVNIGDPNIQNWVKTTFPLADASATYVALTALSGQVASRAEVLWGRGTTITDIMVNWALRNTGTNPF